ncbi:unnamed protein product [Closterium sp. NIES-53]
MAAVLLRMLRASPVALLLLLLLQCYHCHVEAQGGKCDLNAGSWVRNPSLPKRYTGLTCKSIRSSLNCQKNGRKDTEYLNYEFKSPGCNIQRFDPKAFLLMMRNKVFLGVGDSFNPNLQHSVRCLIESVAATKDVNGALFKTGLSAQGYVVPSYNATFLTIASSFLVDATPVGAASSSSPWKVNLDVASKEWTPFLRYSHYVVFSAGHWFTNSGNLRQWFVKKQQQKGMTSSAAMTAAYTTMRNYIASSGYTGLPMVLTYTASHYDSAFAATDSVKECSGAKGPMTSKQMAFAAKKSDALEGRTAVVKVFQGNPTFKILDVSKASLMRPDAHMQQFRAGTSDDDCSHFCVPGVPDTWSDLMFSYMTKSI